MSLKTLIKKTSSWILNLMMPAYSNNYESKYEKGETSKFIMHIHPIEIFLGVYQPKGKNGKDNGEKQCDINP